jgi:hypothetical protein
LGFLQMSFGEGILATNMLPCEIGFHGLGSLRVWSWVWLQGTWIPSI